MFALLFLGLMQVGFFILFSYAAYFLLSFVSRKKKKQAKLIEKLSIRELSLSSSKEIDHFLNQHVESLSTETFNKLLERIKELKIEEDLNNKFVKLELNSSDISGELNTVRPIKLAESLAYAEKAAQKAASNEKSPPKYLHYEGSRAYFSKDPPVYAEDPTLLERKGLLEIKVKY